MVRRMSRSFVAGAVALAMLAGFSGVAFAQGASVITGRVTSKEGTPIQGASVLVDATNYGSITGADGRYTINVPASRQGAAAVTARLIGYRALRQTITLNGTRINLDFSLQSAPTQLSEVVVTALSQQREKATLGTAQQTVSSEELTRTQTNNVISAMSGKVSGLQISQGGQMGGTTRIVIRGAGSILGQNQPLFIVDGVPMSNSDYSTASTGGGRDYGSGISDLNMDDVASVTVLKGPNAAALYGSRASNGVVVITTKNARNMLAGTKFTLTSRATYDTPTLLPSYQNNYGQGFTGQFQYVDGAGSGINDGADESWGPKLDGRPIDQFNGKALPWVAHPDNVNNFFKNGSTLSNNIAVSSNFNSGGVRLSLTKDDQKGLIPWSSLNKLAGSLSANYTPFEKMQVAASINYTQLAGQNRAETGYTEGNPLMSFTWFGRQVDLDYEKEHYYNSGSVYGFADGTLQNWNDNYHRNPYWQFDKNRAPDSRDHIIAQASASYEIAPWLTGSLRAGGDNVRFTREEFFAAGNIDRANAAYNGGFTNSSTRSREANIEGLLTAHKSVNMFDLTATFGGNTRRNDSYGSAFGTSGILVPEIYNLSNAGIAPSFSNAESHSAINSTLGSIVATVNKVWTVEVTGRNDWSSTLPKENSSYFYPSVSSSLILSDLFPAISNGGYLSYVKLRGSIANVGSDAAPYQLANLYNGNTNKFSGLALYSLSNSSNNAALKPERTKGQEIGLELGMLDDRVTFDGTVYAKESRDQILPLSLPQATGFTTTVINAGLMTNKGFEMSVTGKILNNRNGLSWNTTFNYNKNKNKVDELAPGITNVQLPGSATTWNVFPQARVGEPYGQFFGRAFLRDSASGQLLLSGGLTQSPGGTNRVLGNINPDWVGGWSNEFRYKNFSLNSLLDIRRGGKTFSVGNMWGTYAGVLQESLNGREQDWDKPGRVIAGLDQSTCGAGSHSAPNGYYVCVGGKPNTTNVTAEDYYHGIYPSAEPYLYDSGFLRLREVRFGWEVPSSLTSKARVSQMNIALVGRNLWTKTDYPNYDPENALNANNAGQGFEMGALPPLRTMGINFTITP
jgi:TonB-linked SusC/RagA family outer membrane protein